MSALVCRVLSSHLQLANIRVPAEMVCYMPVASPFVRLGTEWVDEAFGFAMAWNFWLNMAFLVPFEIVAMNILLNYWTDKVPVEVVIVVIMVLYL